MKKRNSYKYAGIDFTGQRFGRLVVVKKAQKGRSWWECKCDCGNTKILPTYRLFEYKSCGCLEKENKANLQKHTTTHGMTDSVLYHKWSGMKDRCFNKNSKRYNRYGGRGITVCDEWKNSFENFMKWAYEAGYDDNKTTYQQTLDRIDVDGNYEPSNCRWVDMNVQSNNRSNSVKFQYKGKEYCISEFEKEYNIPHHYIYRKIKKEGREPQEVIDCWEENCKRKNKRNKKVS